MTQTAHELQLSDGTSMPYLLYTPDAYEADPTRIWPFILFLHGSGERGHDVDIVRLHGLPRLVETQPDFPCIVLSPQCPLDVRWPSQSEKVMTLLDTVLKGLRVDPSRLYLTGLSMGGEGSWYIGALHPDRFAAVLPICGRMPPQTEGFPEKVSTLKDVPVWVFHGAKDDRAPVEHSKTLAKVLEDCGGNIQLTIFPDGDHFIWDQVYEAEATWDWLLGQRKG
ncbi:MAG: prolyl oligopeptidase family serine peptidase [Anaerolineaceae bacterium]|nr:prolyl oligopeptidase family serine peptidase [Anaerolineaceae bacterium]